MVNVLILETGRPVQNHFGGLEGSFWFTHLGIFWWIFIASTFLCSALLFMRRKKGLFGVTSWTVGHFLGLDLAKFDFFGGLKIWPYSHLPVTNIPKCVPPPPLPLP